jgi:hypothetical protein
MVGCSHLNNNQQSHPPIAKHPHHLSMWQWVTALITAAHVLIRILYMDNLDGTGWHWLYPCVRPCQYQFIASKDQLDMRS